MRVCKNHLTEFYEYSKFSSLYNKGFTITKRQSTSFKHESETQTVLVWQMIRNGQSQLKFNSQTTDPVPSLHQDHRSNVFGRNYTISVRFLPTRNILNSSHHFDTPFASKKSFAGQIHLIDRWMLDACPERDVACHQLMVKREGINCTTTGN
ncbi:hypothetical protein AVEN_64286-1 [Araneus ventricosus]|uniref:Uncharacterized protein n=1 Tax=Araneus ventricosus TaxID=182803 RepID=A0A4Y2MXK1_ARAVE|nr:hypothetical protein AVEN_64286-1 [Araneus ventricosus]